jgi:glycosyltransferase involved in cell wall biosynthesis
MDTSRLGFGHRAHRQGHVGSDRPRVVAMVSDAVHPYHRGGKEVRYYELSRRLADRADVHVYTMNWWAGPSRQRTGSVTYHALCKYRPLYSGERRSVRQAVFFALACARLLVRRFDVIEADHMPYLQIPVLRLIAGIRRKRLVVTWHEVWGRRYWQDYLGRAGVAAWLVEWLAMRLPHHIVAASPHTAERLKATLGQGARVSVAPNGINLAAIHRAPPVGRPVDIAAVGRLISHKRIDMLLDAVAMLRQDGCLVTCRVIGDGPERERLREHARAVGVADAVEFRYDVEDQGELYGLLKSAKIFVAPSAREGFGIAVLEAIACGLPVVTTSAPDNLAQYVAAKSARGVICDADAESLADTLKGVLRGGEAGMSAGHPEDAWLAEYTWEATASRVARALKL